MSRSHRSHNPEEVCCFSCDELLKNCECGDTHTYENENGPTCPYCGHLNRADEADGHLYTEDTNEYECGECSKAFDVSVCISFSWIAYRQKENK